MAININIKENVENRLKFEPLAQYDNLCTGLLTSVEVSKVEIGVENKKGVASKSEYAGKTISKLSFNFENHRDNVNDYKRYYTFSLLSFMTQSEEKGKFDTKTIEKLVTNEIDRIRHIANAYVPATAPNAIHKYQPFLDGINAVAQVIDTDDVDAKVEATTKWYEAIESWFNGYTEGTGKNSVSVPCVYKEKDNYIPMVMKLTVSYKNVLDFPQYVREGFIQRLKWKTVGNVKKIDTSITFAPDETVTIQPRTRKAPAGNLGTDAPTESGTSQLDALLNNLRG